MGLDLSGCSSFLFYVPRLVRGIQSVHLAALHLDPAQVAGRRRKKSTPESSSLANRAIVVNSIGAFMMLTLPEFVVPPSIAEAKIIQDTLRSKIRVVNDFGELHTIAGVDVAHASIVLLSLQNLEVLEAVQAFVPVSFPYVPGFLSFREIPALLAALAKLTRVPDLLMVDGQGIAHPRRMGIAAHLGVLIDMPTIGVAKSCLAGRFEMPGLSRGSSSPLILGKERIGTVLRSRDNVKPLFISPGHRVDVETSVALTMQCLTRYRLPEPTRLADKFSKIKKVNDAADKELTL
jgi:deoxyribonuclease V